MKIRYGSLENVVQAHHAGIRYGAIVGYYHHPEKGFGLQHWGFGKDLVSAQKTADILESMAKEQIEKNEK
jgi:hypothetical protein